MKSRITGILIVSGLSGRMNSFKPLLQFEGMSFVFGVTLKLGLVCDDVIVVVGHNHKLIEEEFEYNFNRFAKQSENVDGYISKLKLKTKLVYNQSYKKGMFTSLQKGLQSCKERGWYLYHFVDQPSLPLNFYWEFINQIEKNFNWIQPRYNQKNAHPILFDENVSEQIIKLDENESLKNISRSAAINKRIWECNYREVLTDIDTKKDYDKLIKSESRSLVRQLNEYLSKS